MQQNLNWIKKGGLSGSYEIFNNETQVGSLTTKYFKEIAQGELNEKKYTFKTSGFLKPKTQIIDTNENKAIGEITYSNMMTGATIKINGQIFNLKYNSLWSGKKWRISSLDESQVLYISSFFKGQINSNTDDNQLLILSGLVVSNYFSQMTILIMLAVFIPFLTVVIPFILK